jgi:hypothetical protein
VGRRVSVCLGEGWTYSGSWQVAQSTGHKHPTRRLCSLGRAISPGECDGVYQVLEGQSGRVAVCHDGSVREGTDKRQDEEKRA